MRRPPLALLLRFSAKLYFVGVWIATGIDNQFDLYVEEDSARIDRDCFGIPILAPADIPSGSTISVCLEPQLAADILRAMTIRPAFCRSAARRNLGRPNRISISRCATGSPRWRAGELLPLNL